MRWTPAEEAYLREHYPRRGARAAAQWLGRSIDAVRAKARTMGLEHRPWY